MQTRVRAQKLVQLVSRRARTSMRARAEIDEAHESYCGIGTKRDRERAPVAQRQNAFASGRRRFGRLRCVGHGNGERSSSGDGPRWGWDYGLSGESEWSIGWCIGWALRLRWSNGSARRLNQVEQRLVRLCTVQRHFTITSVGVQTWVELVFSFSHQQRATKQTSSSKLTYIQISVW